MHIGWILCGLIACCSFAAETVTLADFTAAGHRWHGNPRTRVVSEYGALTVELTGEDPWLEGPVTAIPGYGKATKLRITLDADSAIEGACQLFFAAPGKSFSDEPPVFLRQIDEKTYQGLVPVIAAQMRLRVDPPGESGRFTLRALRATPMIALAGPVLTKPVPAALSDSDLRLNSGSVSVTHGREAWNTITCLINGQLMAQTNPLESLTYWDGQQAVAVPTAAAKVSAATINEGFAISAEVTDAGGAIWQLKRAFTADHGAVRIETSVQVSEPREVAHLPWLTLFSGLGSFGASKSQALLPGVEYLADEPSSNEKEVRGAAANRRIPATYKVCYPMMALAAGGNWFSVTWQPGEIPVSPVFDSPDRLFDSGGHVFGLWSPAVGEDRLEGDPMVYGTVKLEAGKRYSCVARLSGGRGDVITEAIGDYVLRSNLPPLPTVDGGFAGAVRLLAYGWLDSAAREGTHWRHAVWGSSFQAALAEDVPAYLLWLAANTTDVTLKARLQQTAAETIRTLPAGSPGINGISHVKRLTGALLYGNLEHLVDGAATRVKDRTAKLAAAGGVAHYTPAPGKPDYASTLGSDQCNGFTAMTLEGILQDATLTGDEAAITAALAALDQLTQHYAGQVPHGAQPWEMPLHTPDIVAAARLVRCYVQGYLLSGKAEYLDQARYWAWTGAAMVYLAPPTPGVIGNYATIGVIGATNWTAPNWIGQPVQWCGLVYRSAVQDLARIDGEQGSLWQQLASGITLAGVQMCFPADDPKQRGGLLPDYFLLKEQKRDGPAINPGTVQAHLAEAFGKTPMVTVTRLSNGMLLHCPGDARQETTDGPGIKISITAWPETPYRILLTRATQAPASVSWNGTAASAAFQNKAAGLIINLTGSGTLVIAP